MPMFFCGFKPNHVTRSNFLNRSTFALSQTASRRHDQRLTERVRAMLCARLARTLRSLLELVRDRVPGIGDQFALSR